MAYPFTKVGKQLEQGVEGGESILSFYNVCVEHIATGRLASEADERGVMKDTLKPGATAQFAFRIPAEKTVPHLYPEAAEFREMPTVFATGFMVGLMEWTCLKVLESHLDEGEGSLGVHIDVSHIAATVPGQTVTVDAECTGVAGRRIAFKVQAPTTASNSSAKAATSASSCPGSSSLPASTRRPSSPASCRSAKTTSPSATVP